MLYEISMFILGFVVALGIVYVALRKRNPAGPKATFKVSLILLDLLFFTLYCLCLQKVTTNEIMIIFTVVLC